MRLPSPDQPDASSGQPRATPEQPSPTCEQPSRTSEQPSRTSEQPSRTPSARRFDGIASLRLRGRGRVTVQLKGSGLLTLRRGRFDDVCFEGRGVPRHLSANCVHLSAARGCLVLEGEGLELEFHGGRIDASLVGEFEVEVRGVESGPQRPKGRPGQGLRLEGIERMRRGRAA